MTYTYDDRDRAFYEAVYDMLVREAGAIPGPVSKETFVLAYTRVEHRADEYRCCGLLGFGGKFYRTSGRFYVSMYPEDRTPKREARRTRVNELLGGLVEKYRPRP